MPPSDDPRFAAWKNVVDQLLHATAQTASDQVNPVAELQREWAANQAALWRAFMPPAADAPETETASPIKQLPVTDRRFSSEHWAESPVFDYMRRAYLLNADYMSRVVEHAAVPDEAQRNKLRFTMRQFVDAMAPSNFAATNPDVIKTALATKGESLRTGILNLLGDLERGSISSTDASAFEIGHNLATTPGAVVYENEIFQLIQYAPLTDKVAQRPLLIVPPCINKFYILDLQAHNSFVRYAVEQGFTVFLMSWRNVKDAQGALHWDDYLDDGILNAIGIVGEICKVKQINALGFCVGGTMLTSALAVAKARGEAPVASLTLLTSLLDFSTPGDLGVFVNDTVIKGHEARIGKGGILPGRDLSAVFSALRANDMIWQYVVGNYLKGGRPAPFDLLYWNSDPTNLPGPFLVWYLRNMYQHNLLRQAGQLTMCGTTVDLKALDMPAFIFAANEDHIVPWRGAYASQRLLGGEPVFCLGASGHVAGVINPAAGGKRSYRIGGQAGDDAEAWLETSEEKKGSWWPAWSAWLGKQGGRQIAARAVGNAKYQAIEAAPGRYVKEKA